MVSGISRGKNVLAIVTIQRAFFTNHLNFSR